MGVYEFGDNAVKDGICDSRSLKTGVTEDGAGKEAALQMRVDRNIWFDRRPAWPMPRRHAVTEFGH
jgi:hypothetical protein